MGRRKVMLLPPPTSGCTRVELVAGSGDWPHPRLRALVRWEPPLHAHRIRDRNWNRRSIQRRRPSSNVPLGSTNSLSLAQSAQRRRPRRIWRMRQWTRRKTDIALVPALITSRLAANDRVVLPDRLAGHILHCRPIPSPSVAPTPPHTASRTGPAAPRPCTRTGIARVGRAPAASPSPGESSLGRPPRQLR